MQTVLAIYGNRFLWVLECRTVGAVKPRESDRAQLGGFKTVTMNWTINDGHKHAFLQKLREITGGAA